MRQHALQSNPQSSHPRMSAQTNQGTNHGLRPGSLESDSGCVKTDRPHARRSDFRFASPFVMPFDFVSALRLHQTSGVQRFRHYCQRPPVLPDCAMTEEVSAVTGASAPIACPVKGSVRFFRDKPCTAARWPPIRQTPSTAHFQSEPLMFSGTSSWIHLNSTVIPSTTPVHGLSWCLRWLKPELP